MSDQPDHSGIDSIVRGDADRARRLRATLAVVARRTDDEDLRRTVREVLAGRVNVRRALLHPALNAMAAKNLENLEKGLERLDPEQREDVLSRVGKERTPDEEIEEMREPTPTSDGRRAPGEDPGRPRGPQPPAGGGGTW
ncbi:hypothetical protein [Phycicoccus avicenniae]|uniref:hypothetical protein n=1 Tax=Phycicoccus avicenniae TaxID=2828860 RepID=UPI003D2C83BE